MNGKHKYCYQCKHIGYSMGCGLRCHVGLQCHQYYMQAYLIHIYPTRKACKHFKYSEKYIKPNTGFKIKKAVRK